VIDLREVRKGRGYTQFELGVLTGLGQTGIAKAESGDRQLSPEATIRVIRALSLSPTEAWAVPELAFEPPDKSMHPSRAVT